MEPTQVRLTIPDSVDQTALLGPTDALLRRVEGSFDALVSVRGSDIRIAGPAEAVEQATSVFSRLIALVEAGETPTAADVDLIVEQVRRGSARAAGGSAAEVPGAILTHRGRAIRPKTAGQRAYVEAIRSHTITFGVGPAGTGKTYLAMAMAVSALTRHEVGRIVLTRPVVEAGESLGFLPGTLEEKLDPYVRPLYDALFDMVDRERALALVEQGVIEVAPLAFMRGRTFADAFVILDEAQNTTPEQMKMFLTRLGFGSTFVVTGDATQRDLGGLGGLDSARRALAGVGDIAFVDLGAEDIVRHTLVARIVDAYARAEAAGRPGARPGGEKVPGQAGALAPAAGGATAPAPAADVPVPAPPTPVSPARAADVQAAAPAAAPVSSATSAAPARTAHGSARPAGHYQHKRGGLS